MHRNGQWIFNTRKQIMKQRERNLAPKRWVQNFKMQNQTATRTVLESVYTHKLNAFDKYTINSRKFNIQT